MAQQTVIIIADYGAFDPAFTEVILQLQKYLPEAHFYPLSTPAFSTINMGFWLYQLTMTQDLKNTYIFANTAPRKDTKSAQKNNSGEKLMYAKLKNGFELLAVNAGYAFSFLKDEVAAFHLVNVENEGSQFRSRDKYPPIVAQMVEGNKAFLGQEIATDTIPDVPERVIASIDGFGNLKTTIRRSKVAFTAGAKVKIDIGTQAHVATFTDSVFSIKEGELAFAPGSSGHDDKFMEIFVRGGSASRLFDKPSIEEEIRISVL